MGLAFWNCVQSYIRHLAGVLFDSCRHGICPRRANRDKRQLECRRGYCHQSAMGQSSEPSWAITLFANAGGSCSFPSLLNTRRHTPRGLSYCYPPAH